MVRITNQHILLIGDTRRQMSASLAQALPAVRITRADSIFDGVAELAAHSYTTVLAAVEPIERRPESAVKTLRQAAGNARLMLFGHATLEPLSRKMLAFGCDDYILTPASPAELIKLLDSHPEQASSAKPEPALQPTEPKPRTDHPLLMSLPLADIFLEALVQHPHQATGYILEQLNAQLRNGMQVQCLAPGSPLSTLPAGLISLAQPIRADDQSSPVLHLVYPRSEEEASLRRFLTQLGELLAKADALQDRHQRLQKLAITDELTGVYNTRYFHHSLDRILERARARRSPVTLLLFDIDNFKRYNDQYGHGVGDDILRQTAALMRRCCRDHDLVARIGGDEFAVVFWEKEGPRQPRDPKASAGPSRPPQTPLYILERFRRLIATQNFSGLGPSGRGTLTISGGLAVYPFDAQARDSLIEAADKALMFGAKQAGKNSIFLVGGNERVPLPDSDPS